MEVPVSSSIHQLKTSQMKLAIYIYSLATFQPMGINIFHRVVHYRDGQETLEKENDVPWEAHMLYNTWLEQPSTAYHFYWKYQSNVKRKQRHQAT